MLEASPQRLSLARK